MNLVGRLTISFVLASLVVFLIGGVISFNVMMREVNDEQQRFLMERLDRVTGMIVRRKPKDTLKLNKLVIIPLNGLQEESRSFSDTLVLHSTLDRIETHLKLDAVRNVGGKSYFISLYDVIIEQDDIREGLVESLLTMYLILLGAMLVIGFIFSTYLLKPFNQTLSVIRNFSLTEPDREIIFPKSSIKEFKRLNLFLDEMTKKVRSDYQLLKEFSENASHELQTPIAIVQSKLEVLLDSDSLSEEQINQISSAQHTIKRLSNLSNSLALLTKIDNNEFNQMESINVSDRINSLLAEFKELVSLKSIELSSAIEPEIKLNADGTLVELLLTNLFNNAIRHNWESGVISIKLNAEFLEVENSGSDLTIDPDELFTRFKKSNQSSSSLGLGLAIVKKICDFYGWKLAYTQSSNMHQLRVFF